MRKLLKCKTQVGSICGVGHSRMTVNCTCHAFCPRQVAL